MSRKRFKPEQIIAILREAEVRLAQGQTVGEICRGLRVSEQSYYRWRRETSDYGCTFTVSLKGGKKGQYAPERSPQAAW
jgi:transposase-like protein